MKILFLQKRPLFPANTGGKIRSLNVLKHLAQWHEVTYLCNVTEEEQKEQSLDQMRELGVRLHAFPWKETPRDSLKFYLELLWNLVSTSFPFTVNKDFDKRIADMAKSLIKNEQFDLVICDFVQMARNTLHLQGVPKVLFQHNVEAQIYERMAEAETNKLKRFFITTQARRMRKFESLAGSNFDGVIAVSKEDEASFKDRYDWNHTSVISTAVDTNYFTLPTEPNKTPGRIVFVGSMDWLPNIDGVTHFVANIWPTVKAKLPHATLDIVGRNPSQHIKKLEDIEGIRVTGSVPDVRPYVHAAELAIVPIYAGGGTRLKIFEFMAMGTPVLSTTIGAEGLNVNSGEEIAIADIDEEFAEATYQLIQQPEKRQSISEQARQLVETRYATEPVARQFHEICMQVVQGKSNR